MKNFKIFSFVLTGMISFLHVHTFCIQKAEILGNGLHYLAKECTQNDSTRIGQVLGYIGATLHSDIKISGVIVAINHKVNGKTAIDVARESKCASCDDYAKLLENARFEAIRVMAQHGDITLEEAFSNQGLAKEVMTNLAKEH